eukprot:4693221-Prymnesium_polylepis.1
MRSQVERVPYRVGNTHHSPVLHIPYAGRAAASDLMVYLVNTDVVGWPSYKGVSRITLDTCELSKPLRVEGAASATHHVQCPERATHASRQGWLTPCAPWQRRVEMNLAYAVLLAPGWSRVVRSLARLQASRLCSCT